MKVLFNLYRFLDYSEIIFISVGACDDVKLSAKFKKVLKTILKVGNTLNDGVNSRAFSIESLLKLQATKAFDNKTSILHYVIMVMCISIVIFDIVSLILTFRLCISMILLVCCLQKS